MTAAVVYILFAISIGSAPPDITALATYESKEACDAAAVQVGSDGKVLLCVTPDSLKELLRANNMAGYSWSAPISSG
jgi:hypothetical protein